MSFTIISNPLLIASVLCLVIVLCEWLVRISMLRHLGTALAVVIAGAVVANVGLVPSSSAETPLYDGIFTYVAPIAIFLLLLEVNLRGLKTAGGPMLLFFALGSLGTVFGVYAGITLLMHAPDVIDKYPALAGMFTGTYTGGSINFNAIAIHYEVMDQSIIYGGAVAVDNIFTMLWMVATLALPKFLPERSRIPAALRATPTDAAQELRHEHDTETINPGHLAALIGLGAGSLWLSTSLANFLGQFGIPVPSILILTTIALILAQIPVFNGLSGSRTLGMYAVYLFLAVIGTQADLSELAGLGSLGVALFLFAGIVVLVHGLFLFGMGAVLKQDWDVVAVASQANIGGSTSALALAKSLGRSDLMLPAILVGSLGNGLGTYLGFLVAGTLG